MEKVASIDRKKPAEEAVTGTVLPADEVRALEGEAPEVSGRARVVDAGAQPLRATTPSRELAKRPGPIAKPETSAFHRTLGIVKAVLPLVQKALPLLDGNVAAVLANILAPSFQGAHVDLKPLEDGLNQIRRDHASVQLRVEAQSTTLKQMGSQLESLNEAAEKLALEQKELAEQLYGFRRRASAFAWVGAGLLAVLLVLNVLLLLRVAGIGR